MASTQTFKLIFFVPVSAAQACKTAIFKAGAGAFPGPGGYTECAFTTKGIGQFRPGSNANPNIGEVGKLEEVEEVKVETICLGRDVAKRAVEELKKAHPYEEPAYEVYKLEHGF
ncbi:structural toxin protein RtxA [Lophiotrema nucula]|uniref:ATP phosphoribosyltransferase n=1 Tax=Lophiotrema nucula TaxID=690887 RepID=A0A6A5ZQ40_9PLEO|nr:structural toxin protein RtxA [Lophiotrema nucula]